MKLLKCSAILLALFLVALAPAVALEANDTNMSVGSFNILYIGNLEYDINNTSIITGDYYAFDWETVGYTGDTGNVDYTITTLEGLMPDFVTPNPAYLKLASDTVAKSKNISIGTNVSMADFDAVVIDMVTLYYYPLGDESDPNGLVEYAPPGAFNVTFNKHVPIISIRCGEWDGVTNNMPSDFIYIRDNPTFTGNGTLYSGNESILDAFFAQDPRTGNFLIYDYTDGWFRGQQKECYNLIDYLFVLKRQI